MYLTVPKESNYNEYNQYFFFGIRVQPILTAADRGPIQGKFASPLGDGDRPE